MTARFLRGTAAATLAAALALTAAACTNPGSTAGGTGGPKDSAVVGIAYEPETLSPSSATARTATPRSSTGCSPSAPT